MGNPVVRFEVGAADHQPLVAFYAELFGWDMQTISE
jgi:predicted enzyme related to lactoylglutathione lyase